jgi:polyisoprenoid-binding protein YceI
MKKCFQTLVMLSTFSLILITFPLTAASYQSAENAGSIIVSGTSSVHDWEVETSTLNGTLTEQDGLISELKVNIPVATVKSDKEGMDKKMYASLNKDDFKEITFVLTGAEKDKEDATGATTLLTGDLTIKKTKKSVTFPVSVSIHADNQMVVEGEYALNMKDYGVPPPKAMLGMIKAGPEVTVKFKWILDKKAANP